MEVFDSIVTRGLPDFNRNHLVSSLINCLPNQETNNPPLGWLLLTTLAQESMIRILLSVCGCFHSTIVPAKSV